MAYWQKKKVHATQSKQKENYTCNCDFKNQIKKLIEELNKFLY